MDFSVSTSSAVVSGGNHTFSLAGMYLQFGLGDYGDAVAEFEVTACFRGGRVGNPNLQSYFDRYQSQFLPTLPYLKFFRKKRRVVLSYETAVADATFLEPLGGPVAAAVFGPALAELAGRLRLIDAKFKRSDAFDLGRFHEDVARLAAEAPRTDEGLAALDARLRELEERRYAAMDWWDRVGVDWDDYHADARRLLDDAFFWDCSDDYAPHGNDTGADLLDDFKSWNRRRRTVPACEMALMRLHYSELDKFDPAAADEPTVRALLRDEPVALNVTNEAMVAAAFAAVKFRGCCDARTRELALRAIERERVADRVEGRAADPERVGKLARVEAALRKVPETPVE